LTYSERQIDRPTPGHSPLGSSPAQQCLAAALLAAASLAVVGCGYSRQGLFPEDVRTVTVQTFQNKTFYKGVQFDLTEALIKQMELETPYKALSGSADTLLEGVITDIQQRKLSRTSTGGLVQEVEVRITVNFQWKDQRTGDLLRQRKGFVGVGRHVLTSPIGESFQTGQHGAVQRLAQQIVATMRSDF